jgi:hypothetical protein
MFDLSVYSTIVLLNCKEQYYSICEHSLPSDKQHSHNYKSTEIRWNFTNSHSVINQNKKQKKDPALNFYLEKEILSSSRLSPQTI